MLGQVANGTRRHGLPVPGLRLSLVLNRMQAHSSLVYTTISLVVLEYMPHRIS